jgi:hypothetical protein
LALGAFLLFFANFVVIQFASSVVLWFLGYHQITMVTRQSPLKLFARNAMSAALLIILAIILGINFTQSVSKRLFESRIQEVITAKLAVFPDAQLVEISSLEEAAILNLQVTVRTSRQPTYAEIVDLQQTIAIELQRPVALRLIDIPTVKLDPLVPPTHTPTPLPNATDTPTATTTPTPTSTNTPTATLTPTQTPTLTQTPTPAQTPTVTSTFTPTPVLAVIANTGGIGVALRDAPARAIMGTLPEGAPVQILHGSETIKGIEWVEIQDVLGRIGWVPAEFLSVLPEATPV